ncbi:hypothetical protein H6758_04225 [Candidatus Nomurabacteria bacterium]|nr:hypothetical protein [Candidatus Nomurabacteria bacterium]
MEKSSQKKAYILTVDMGYGHQRAVYPLYDIGAVPPQIPIDPKYPVISANVYPGIPKVDRIRWEGGRNIYETISRMKKLPVVGKYVFGILDYLQRIEPFYPRRDLSAPTAQLKQIYRMIHRGWGKDLIEKLNHKPLPLITSFFNTAFFAEEHGYKEDIYCLCTDTDIARAWVPLEPKKSRIIYFAPSKRVKDRLMLYGVSPEKIYVTGFPLPKENIGDKKNNKTLRETLGCRIAHLDPHGIYQQKYSGLIDNYLGKQFCRVDQKHVLTIAFAVGGAGAQRDIGITILQSLRGYIDSGQVRLILVAGSRPDVYKYYQQEMVRLGLEKECGRCIEILYADNKAEYFRKFNEMLKTTDILWTKPSELSFYAGLGLPIIMAPTVGSQEDFNKAWLHSIGAGFEQEDPRYTDQWLFDWLSSGWLAQAAMEGFLDAPQNGAYHIENIVLRGKRSEISDTQLM